MPIYEYRCESCGHEMDTLQKMSDNALVDCPSCGKPELIKLISAPGFRLKGGGWYETDFKSKNRKNVVEERKSEKKTEKASGKKDKSSGSTGKDKKTAG